MHYADVFQRGKSNMVANAVKGAAAGVIAVWAMDKLDWFFFRNEDEQARHRTESVRPGGLDPAHVVVNRAADMADTELQPAQPHPAGIAVHYALGVTPATIYGMLRERIPVAKPGQDYLYGLGLGLGLFVIQDEGLNQVTGWSAKQKDYPWQAHARGLTAHLAYGLVLNAVLNLMGAPRPQPKAIQQASYSGQPAERHDYDYDYDFVPVIPDNKADRASTPTLH